VAVGEHHGALRANSEATGGNYTRLLAPVKSLALQFYFQGSFDARPVATALQALLADKDWRRATPGNGELGHIPDIGRLTVADIPKVRKLPLVYDGI
jgi:hypothetical protein